jgi:hypothetical protein
MATLPATEQLNNAPQPTNPATTLAVNFVICQDLSTNYLEQITSLMETANIFLSYLTSF